MMTSSFEEVVTCGDNIPLEAQNCTLEVHSDIETRAVDIALLVWSVLMTPRP